MGKYRTLLATVLNGKTGEPLFLIAGDFANIGKVSGYGVIASAPESQCENRCKFESSQSFLNRT